MDGYWIPDRLRHGGRIPSAWAGRAFLPRCPRNAYDLSSCQVSGFNAFRHYQNRQRWRSYDLACRSSCRRTTGFQPRRIYDPCRTGNLRRNRSLKQMLTGEYLALRGYSNGTLSSTAPGRSAQLLAHDSLPVSYGDPLIHLFPEMMSASTPQLFRFEGRRLIIGVCHRPFPQRKTATPKAARLGRNEGKGLCVRRR